MPRTSARPAPVTGTAGDSATRQEPFLRRLSACPAGTQSGDNLATRLCTGSGDSSWLHHGHATTSRTVLRPPQCLDIFAHGHRPAATQPTTGAPTSARAVVGWTPNPAYGPIPTMRLDATPSRPRRRPRPTPGTASARRSPPAGVAPSPPPPICVDGPSTKIIDGVAVHPRLLGVPDDHVVHRARSARTNVPRLSPPAARRCRRRAADQPHRPVRARSTRTSTAARCRRETITTASNCPTNVFCLGTSCFNIAYTNDADFARSMSMLEAAREAGVYLDSDRMQVFKGERTAAATSC